MMEYQNDIEALCLASTYNLSPPRKVGPARLRQTDPGKYEPDRNIYPATRCMVLAHWLDKTNAIVQYNPAEIKT